LFALREAKQRVKGTTEREGREGIAAHKGGKTYQSTRSEEGSEGIVEGIGYGKKEKFSRWCRPFIFNSKPLVFDSMVLRPEGDHNLLATRKFWKKAFLYLKWGYGEGTIKCWMTL